MSDDSPSSTDQLSVFIDAALEHSGAHSLQSIAEVTWPFILFQHGSRWFGVRAEAVSIVITMESITRVPKQADHVLGVALIRSRLVPVIDLAALLGVAERPQGDEQGLRLVVLTSDDAEIAVVANEARGVVHLRAEDIGHTGSRNRDFISGEVKWRRHMVSIVDTLGLLAAATRREPTP